MYSSRIHEHTIWLRFPGIILKVLRLEDSVYNVYITNQFQATFAQGVWGGVNSIAIVEVTVNSKEENFVTITSKNSASENSKAVALYET
jgi:hypothetical protein